LHALWKPSPKAIEASALTKLSRALSSKTGLDLSKYDDLHRWSVENPGEFWSQVWDDAGLVGKKGDNHYREGSDFISSEFFLDAKINVAENLLAKGQDHEIAIVSILENGARMEITWAQLRASVAAAAAALRSEGIIAGDRVVAWTPNLSETIIFALAALSMGAIVSTSSPDFGPAAVLDRFGQIEPKVLLAAREYSYGGKTFDCTDKLREISASLPTLVKVVVIGEPSSTYTSFAKWIAPHLGAPLTFTRLPFNHPGFVLFSSGTTGAPKCIIHSGAGVLIKGAAEHLYQLDIKAEDRVFFFTTCGWMMWNWLTCVLVNAATIVLYDGSPIYPTPARLFDIAQAEKLTFLGVSAKFIDTSRKADLSPIDTHNLVKLRTIASTGSVLSPEGFDYVYQHIKRDVHLVSMTGGTDICGCFLSGVPNAPVYRGELQGPCLGMATDVFTPTGKSAEFEVKGELVCTVPFPSKPIGFWGDPANEKYRAAYFEGFPKVWTHGDFAAKSATGGFTMFGRSDATLNSKGIRIGTAEIYRVVETFEAIQEAMAVAQEWDGDTRVILFVTLKDGFVLDDELIKEIKRSLKTLASPRHVPEKIIAAPELPRTKSGKLVELAVTDVINRREVRNRDALANPQALDWFVNLADLST
jgi:acetoacetyl-CoA synthetase